MSSSKQRAPLSSADLFHRRFRLRRLEFPRWRPRGAPYGYVSGLGWLAPGLLWIDGWLSLEPRRRLEVRFEIGGITQRHEATCFTAAPFVEVGGLAARRWIVLVPVEQGPDGEAVFLASRLTRLALTTTWGELQWLGACDRWIAADVVGRLLHPAIPPGHLDRLESFLLTAVRTARCCDPESSLFRRNLCSLRRAAELAERPERLVAGGDTEISWTESFGALPDKPEVSVICTLLRPPDLLEHHFVQLFRSLGTLSSETILVVGPELATTELSRRASALSELHGLPVRLIELGNQVPWPAAAAIGAREAKGEVLAFFKDQTLSSESRGLESLVAPLQRDAEVGVTAPVIRNFDGSVRSLGFSFTDEAGPPPRIKAIIPTARTAPRSDSFAACSSECFAIRRSLFEELGGFSGAFVHEDFETIDLCLRVATAGWSVRGVETTVTRFVESTAPPPLWRGSLVYCPDLETLRQRNGSMRSTSPPLATSEDPREQLTATVVIPTLNPGRELADVLDLIEAQQGALLDGILVIDSSSTDGTRKLLETRGVEHEVIARKDFNHGLTRNLGIQRARGDVVVFLSQDALPRPGWLAGLMDVFGDPLVAGAYGRQVPRANASPFALDRLAHWPASQAEPRRQVLPPREAFETMPLARRLETICFDNVSSAVRRNVAAEIPFRELSFGEDRDWAYRAMAAGYTLRYCSESEAVHSHDRSAWLDLRRTAVDHRLIHEMLSTETELTHDPGIGAVVTATLQEMMRLLDVASRAPTTVDRLRARARLPAQALVRTLGPYLGARTAYLSAAGSRRWSWIGRMMAQ